MEQDHTQHLSDEQITWAIVDQEELPEPARKHLAGCTLCSGRVKALERTLHRIGELASRSVPMAFPRPVAEGKESKVSLFDRIFGLRRLGLSVALAGILLAIVGGGLFVRQYRHYRQVAAFREEVLGDAALMAEVDQLIENPLPPVYNEISPEDYSVMDKGFMDFIIPAPGAGKKDAGSA